MSSNEAFNRARVSAGRMKGEPQPSENELRKRKDLLRFTFDSAPVGIYTADPGGRYLNANVAYQRMVGYTEAELRRRSVFSLIHPHDLPHARILREELIAGRREFFEVEKRYRTKNGGQIWVRDKVSLVKDAIGGPRCVITVSQDITERKKVERALRDTNDRLQAIVTASPLPIVTIDRAGNVTMWNPAAERMFGWTRDEVIGRPLPIIPDEQRAEFPSRVAHEFEVENRGVEAIRRKKDGSPITVGLWTAPLRNSAGESTSIMKLLDDITERKRAEDALRQSQRTYAALVNSIDGIVWEADAQTFRFSFVSPQAERMLGYPVERWLSEPDFWRDHLHPDDREAAVDFCLTATREKRAHDFEYRMLAADGRTVWLRDLVTVVVENDRAVRLRGIMVDITERKRAEEALRSSEGRLRRVLEDRERLARDLHDDVVQRIYAIGLGLEETRRLAAEDAHAAGEQLAGAIAGLNEVIRDVRRHITGSAPQMLDDRKLRSELQALAGAVDGAQRLRFQVETDPGAASRLSHDANTHVLNIAREAMSNSLRHSKGRRGLVSLRPHPEGVRLVVADDGVGFDTRNPTSSGQGLRNIEARARQLAARLEVRSGTARGTRIIVDIPVRQLRDG